MKKIQTNKRLFTGLSLTIMLCGAMVLAPVRTRAQSAGTNNQNKEVQEKPNASKKSPASLNKLRGVENSSLPAGYSEKKSQKAKSEKPAGEKSTKTATQSLSNKETATGLMKDWAIKREKAKNKMIADGLSPDEAEKKLKELDKQVLSSKK